MPVDQSPEDVRQQALVRAVAAHDAALTTAQEEGEETIRAYKALRRGQDPKKRAIANLPPTFRQAEHRVDDDGGLVTTWAEQDLRPGHVIMAGDRNYVAGVSGELRRCRVTDEAVELTSPRAKPVRPETKAQTKGRGRIEAKLAESAERQKRRLRSRQNRRKQGQTGPGATK